jgi:hypothetical protein
MQTNQKIRPKEGRELIVTPHVLAMLNFNCHCEEHQFVSLERSEGAAN